MTARLLTSGSALGAPALWAILIVMTLGALLSGCGVSGTFANKPKPTISEAPRQPTIIAPNNHSVPAVPVAGEVRIAVLLPLSHPSRGVRVVATALLQAAQMGMFDMGARSMVLLPRDTGTTPESAAAAANDAIDKGAQLILGPLLANDVRAVAPVARARNVPVIAFSTDRTVAGDGVFLLSFLPGQEVGRIVSYAASKGLGRFAALVPSTPYGQRVEEAFRAAVMENGTELVAVQHYQHNTQALDSAVKGISKAGFDAIFLPEGGAMLRSLGPIMTINGIDPRKVQLLGTGLWDDAAVAREPSLIGGMFAVPPPDQRKNFITQYQQFYGVEPPRIASLAYDAVALSATLAGGAPSQRYSHSAIANPDGFAGIDGIFRFRSDGVTERGFAVMQLGSGGRMTIVSPAPDTFQSQGF